MKDAKEILEEYENKYYSIEGETTEEQSLRNFIISAIKQAQIEAYNEAINDAAENAECVCADYHGSADVDRDSILKLKK